MNEMVDCPIECVRSACPEPDWLEKHSSFVLTLVGILSGLFGMVFTYFLKSRCKTIKCCGLECDRQVVELDPKDVRVE